MKKAQKKLIRQRQAAVELQLSERQVRRLLVRLREVGEGMPNVDVIRRATIVGADLMGWSGNVGQIAAGKFADLIAVSGDHVTFVMKGGSVVKNDLIFSALTQLPRY